METLYLLAVDPLAETLGVPNSYGFREERSTAVVLMDLDALRGVAETHRVERGICAISLQKLCMRTLFHNPACLQHNNAISPLNG
jgi:hypothetical protein